MFASAQLGTVLVPAAKVAEAGSLAHTPGDGATAVMMEVEAFMEHRQPPIVAVVTADDEEPDESLWLQEAHTAARGASMCRELALMLPCESEVRTRLLERADDWQLFAALRGVTPAPLTAAPSQTG